MSTASDIAALVPALVQGAKLLLDLAEVAGSVAKSDGAALDAQAQAALDGLDGELGTMRDRVAALRARGGGS